VTDGTRVLPTGITEARVDARDGALVSLTLKGRLEIRGDGPWDGTQVRTHARLRQVADGLALEADDPSVGTLEGEKKPGQRRLTRA